MAGLNAGYRAKLFRGIHAEAAKRKIDHDALRDVCKQRYDVHSMSELSEGQLLALYRDWTGKGLKRTGRLPRAGEVSAKSAVEIVSGADLLDLAAEFAKRAMGHESQGNLIARQLRGRREIRTRKDFVRVMGAMRAMNRREAKKA